jgi:hypothetical protein
MFAAACFKNGGTDAFLQGQKLYSFAFAAPFDRLQATRWHKAVLKHAPDESVL